jgi:hypothetical protein
VRDQFQQRLVSGLLRRHGRRKIRRIFLGGLQRFFRALHFFDGRLQRGARGWISVSSNICRPAPARPSATRPRWRGPWRNRPPEAGRLGRVLRDAEAGPARRNAASRQRVFEFSLRPILLKFPGGDDDFLLQLGQFDAGILLALLALALTLILALPDCSGRKISSKGRPRRKRCR